MPTIIRHNQTRAHIQKASREQSGDEAEDDVVVVGETCPSPSPPSPKGLAAAVTTDSFDTDVDFLPTFRSKKQEKIETTNTSTGSISTNTSDKDVDAEKKLWPQPTKDLFPTYMWNSKMRRKGI